MVLSSSEEANILLLTRIVSHLRYHIVIGRFETVFLLDALLLLIKYFKYLIIHVTFILFEIRNVITYHKKEQHKRYAQTFQETLLCIFV